MAEFAERFINAYGAGQKAQRDTTVRANAYAASQGDEGARAAVYGADPQAGFNVDEHFAKMREAQYKQHQMGAERIRQILYPLTQAKPEEFPAMLAQGKAAAKAAGIPDTTIAMMNTPEDIARAWQSYQTYEMQMAQKKLTFEQGMAEREQSEKERTGVATREHLYGQAARDRAASNRSGAPANYMWATNEAGEQVLTPIPGGAADRSNKPLPPGVEKRYEALGDTAGQLGSLKASWKDDYTRGVVGVGGDVRLWAERNLVGGTDATEWWAAYDRYKNVVRNQLFGSALTPSEQAAFERADINSSMGPTQVRRNLKTQRTIINNAVTRRTRAAAAQGHNMDAVNALTGGILPDEVDDRDPPSSARLPAAPGETPPPAQAAPPPAQTAAPAAPAGPKEGDRGTSKSGKPTIFKGGKWHYATQ